MNWVVLGVLGLIALLPTILSAAIAWARASVNRPSARLVLAAAPVAPAADLIVLRSQIGRAIGASPRAPPSALPDPSSSPAEITSQLARILREKLLPPRRPPQQQPSGRQV